MHPAPRLLPVEGWLCYGLLIVLASCWGCGSAGRIPVTQVTGEVLWQGKPMTEALVMLHPTVDLPIMSDLKPRGRTDAQGRFQLTTYDEHDGAPLGEYFVTVEWPEVVPNPDGGDARALVGPDRLQGKYAEPQTSGLKLQVIAGQTQLAPIVLP